MTLSPEDQQQSIYNHAVIFTETPLAGAFVIDLELIEHDRCLFAGASSVLRYGLPS